MSGPSSSTEERKGITETAVSGITQRGKNGAMQESGAVLKHVLRIRQSQMVNKFTLSHLDSMIP